MHIRKQKKLTYRIGVAVVLASMMFLAEGAHGMHPIERIVTEHYEGILKKRETVHAEEKRTLEEELNQKNEEIKLTELNLKSVIGGAEDAPIVEEVKKLVGIVKEDAATLEEALGSLNENLRDVESPTLVGKVEALKETLAVTQEEKIALKEEKVALEEEKVALEQKHRKAKDKIRGIKETTGGSGTGTPILTRLDGFRNSSDTIKVLEQKLVTVPGEGVLEKVEVLVAEELAKEEAIIAQEVTINDLKESLEEKEEAYNDLYVKLLTSKSEAKSLDVQLSLVLVELSEKTKQLNQVLENHYQVLEHPHPKTPDRPYMNTPDRRQP